MVQLRLLRGQSKEVRDIVAPYVRTGAWFSHPEAVLLTLAASPVLEEREFAVQHIVKLRGTQDKGDIRNRPRKTPFLNFDATVLVDIIDWGKDTIHEPVFTCSLSTEQVTSILTSPLQVDYYPCHTQSTERVVKQVCTVQLTISVYIHNFFQRLLKHPSKCLVGRDGTAT